MQFKQKSFLDMRNPLRLLFLTALVVLSFSFAAQAQKSSPSERQEMHDAQTKEAAKESALAEFQTIRDRLFEAITEQDAASVEVLKSDLLAVMQQLDDASNPRLAEIRDMLAGYTFSFEGPAVPRLQEHLALINEFGALFE